MIKTLASGRQWGLLLVMLLLGSGSASCVGGEDHTEQRSTAAFQQEILADGIVDRLEYERAILAEVACLEAEGLEVLDLEFDEDLQQYGFLVPVTSDSPAILRECHRQYSAAVARAWVRQIADQAVSREDVPRALADCLKDRGVAVPTDPTAENLAPIGVESPAEYQACIDEILP